MIDPPLILVVVVILGLALVAAKLLGRDRFLALAGSTVLCVVVAECGARLLDVGNPAIAEWIESRDRGHDYPYEPNSKLIYRYPDDPRGYFGENNEVVGHINGLGYRGEERGFEKPEGAKRIVVLGDSLTLGMGVRDEDTLPYRLEQNLRSDGSAVEVINLGRTTSSTRYQIKLLRTYGLAFDPDVVLLIFFLNDIEGPGGLDPVQPRPVLSRVRRHSFFLNAVISSIQNRIVHGDVVAHYRKGYADGSPAWETVRSALLRGERMTRQHGAKFVVAVYPELIRLDDYPFAHAHHKIVSFCEAEGIPVLDLRGALAGYTDRELWVHRTDRHGNEIASRIAATTVADFLRERELP